MVYNSGLSLGGPLDSIYYVRNFPGIPKMEFAASGFRLSCSEDCTTTPCPPPDRNLQEIYGHRVAPVVGLRCSNCYGQGGVPFRPVPRVSFHLSSSQGPQEKTMDSMTVQYAFSRHFLYLFLRLFFQVKGKSPRCLLDRF